MGVTTGYHRQALWFLILGLIITLVSSSSSLDDTKKSDSGITSYVGRILPNEDAPTNNVERHSHSKGTDSKKKKTQGVPEGRSSSKKTKHEESSKSRYHKAPKTHTAPKGRTTGHASPEGRSTKEDKPNWYYTDPGKYLGRAVLEYDPQDPNEPDPLKKIRAAGKRKPGGPGNSTTVLGKGKRLQVIDFPASAEIDPDAPGWFALKTNTQFGKKLKLGTLLRKKIVHGNGTDPGHVDLGDDGENLDEDDKLSRLNRKYDKNCRWLEYRDTKASIIPPRIKEETRQLVQGQNRHLSEFFLNLTLLTPIEKFDDHYRQISINRQPDNGFKLLKLTKEIFTNQICKDQEFDANAASYNPDTDKLLPKDYVEGILQLFIKLHSLTNPSETTDYLDNKEYDWIEKYLSQCDQPKQQNKKLKWYTDECKERVLAFDQENNYACTPYDEFDFNTRKYDPILDTIWHMVTAVQSHCFESFQENLRMWHKYSMAMADLFPPQMRLRWSASEDNKKFYTRLFGPHYEVYFDNMNRCLYAATMRSNVPYLVPRFEGHRRTRFARFENHNIM